MTPSDEALTPEPSDDEDAEGEEEDNGLNGYSHTAQPVSFPERLGLPQITAPTSRQSEDSDGEGEDEQSEGADEEFAYSEDDGAEEDDDAMDEDEDDDDGDYDFGSKKKKAKGPKPPKPPREPKIRIKRESWGDVS
jgi:hypothetical protein